MILIRWILGMPMAALVTAGLFFMMAQLIKDKNVELPPEPPIRDFKITADMPPEGPTATKPPRKLPSDPPPEPDLDFTKSGEPPKGPVVAPVRVPVDTTPPGQKIMSGPTIKVPPAYPESCRSRGIEGNVTVEFDVGPDGGVLNPRVISTPHSCFNRTVLKAVSGWKYPPAANGGMRYGVIERFNFQLEQ